MNQMVDWGHSKLILTILSDIQGMLDFNLDNTQNQLAVRVINGAKFADVTVVGI